MVLINNYLQLKGKEKNEQDVYKTFRRPADLWFNRPGSKSAGLQRLQGIAFDFCPYGISGYGPCQRPSVRQRFVYDGGTLFRQFCFADHSQAIKNYKNG